jgi:hypothetical protein
MTAKALDTEDAAFASDPRPPRFDADGGVIEFERPGAVVVTGAS